MNFDARLQRLEQQDNADESICPDCGTERRTGIVVWEVGAPEPETGCARCNARLLVIRMVEE